MGSGQLDDEAIFSVARRIDTPSARDEYLRGVCGGDRILFDRVARLLRVYTEQSHFLESPAMSLAGVGIPPMPFESPGTVIGHYKLLEQIGVGGMGLVFMAEQQHPMRRMVALKIIKPGMDTRQVIARFEAERQVLAMMDHPNISKVLDAGATDSGRPYFVMELVRGIPVTEYCDKALLPTRERLRLFITICEAVQHAHQKGIIHRDLKPSNILVTMYDDKAVPKVIDFGIAKAMNQRLVEQTLFTNFAQMIGTPTYMSPEQAQMSGLDVDTRSDVYSLGVLLYELLTGLTPFDQKRLREAGYDEMRRIIRDEEPPRPSMRVTALDAASQLTIAENRTIDRRKFSQSLHGDLDWIVMKALEKDRTRRYESVSELIADVKRYLADKPVDACPPSALYSLWKFARRRKPLVMLLSLSAVFLLVSMVGLAIGYVLVSREKIEVLRQQELVTAQEKKLLAREETIRTYLYSTDMQVAFRAYARGEVSQARERLFRHIPDQQGADERGFEWHYLARLCDEEDLHTYRVHQRDVFGIRYSKDGKLLISTSADRSAVIWDVAEFKPQKVLREFNDDVNGLDLSEDGTLVAIAEENKAVRVWELATGREIARLEGFNRPVVQVFFTPDQQHLIATEIEYSSGVASFSLWNIENKKQVRRVDGHRALAVSTKAGILASAALNGRISLWSLPQLEQKANWQSDAREILCGAFSADGEFLATGSRGRAILWSVSNFAGRQLPLSISMVIRGLAFSPDGNQLVSVGDDATARVWDVSSATSLRMLQSTHGRLWSADFSPNGTTLAVACDDGSIEVRDLSKLTLQKVRIHKSKLGYRDVALDSSGEHVALLDLAGINVSILDAKSGNILDQFSTIDNDEIWQITFSPDSQSLWAGSLSGMLRQRILKSRVWRDEAKFHGGLFPPIFKSPTGRFLSIGDEIWDSESRRKVNTFGDFTHQTPIGFLSESIAVSRRYSEVLFWDLKTGLQIPKHIPLMGFVYMLAIAPDGKTLAIVTGSSVMFYDVASGAVTATLVGNQNNLTRLVFSPDGRTLVTGSELGEIKLWHRSSAQHVGDLHGHLGGIRQLAFSDDGSRLISAGDTPDHGCEIFVWGLTGGTKPNSVRSGLSKSWRE